MHNHVIHDQSHKLFASIVIHCAEYRSAEGDNLITDQEQHERFREFLLSDHGEIEPRAPGLRNSRSYDSLIKRRPLSRQLAMLADRIFSEGRRNIGMIDLKHGAGANDSASVIDI